MSYAITRTIEIVTDECCRCGIVFGYPKNWWERKRQTGDGFYCPNGCSLVFRAPSADWRIREIPDCASSPKTHSSKAYEHLRKARSHFQIRSRRQGAPRSHRRLSESRLHYLPM